MQSIRFFALLCVVSAVIVACERQPVVRAPASPPKSEAPAPAGNTAGTPSSTAESTAGSVGAVNVLGMAFTLPDGWKQVPPANQMRLAEVVVGDTGSEQTKTCLVVFSTAGGDVQSNIARWAGQMRDAAGQAPKPEMRSQDVGGTRVHVVEFKGAYLGMGDQQPKSDWMMRGAIFETRGGLLFIKMTGPAAAMESAAAGWKALIESARTP